MTQKLPSPHHRTTLSRYEACIGNRKKMFDKNIVGGPATTFLVRNSQTSSSSMGYGSMGWLLPRIYELSLGWTVINYLWGHPDHVCLGDRRESSRMPGGSLGCRGHRFYVPGGPRDSSAQGHLWDKPYKKGTLRSLERSIGSLMWKSQNFETHC